MPSSASPHMNPRTCFRPFRTARALMIYTAVSFRGDAEATVSEALTLLSFAQYAVAGMVRSFLMRQDMT